MSEYDLKEIYDACTPDEREALLSFMLEKIEARRRDEIKMLISDPKQLAGIPLARLQDIAEIGVLTAHLWIVDTYPQAKEVLTSLECLISFTSYDEDLTVSDFTDVISSLEEIWKVAGGKYDADLLTDSRAHIEADRHAAPGRPTIEGTRESVPSARPEITTRPQDGPRSKARRRRAVSTETKGEKA